MAFKPNYGRDRGRHVLGAMKKCERETRKLRCAKPSAPKSSRRRMKPILDWTKSKAEARAQHRRLPGSIQLKRDVRYGSKADMTL